MPLRSFRAQLMLLFGLFAALVVGGTAWVGDTLLGRQLLHERGDSLSAVANGTALLFADGLNEQLREVQMLARSDDARRGSRDVETWTRDLETLRRGHRRHVWIGVTDADGRVFAATDGLLVGADVSARPWFIGARSRPFVGDVHPAKLLSALLPAEYRREPMRFVDFAAPMRSPTGELQGTLAVHTDWRWARDVIDRVRTEEQRSRGVQVYVFDRDGRVLHSPPDSDAGDLPEGGHLPGTKAALTRWAKGGTFLSVGVRLPAEAGDPADLGWTVVARQARVDALAEVVAPRSTLWRLGGLIVAISMFLGWLLASRVSAPLERIAAAAQRIRGGEADVEIPVVGGARELEHLSHALAGMTKTLVARKQALKEANAELERRVLERTAALAKANAHLAQLAHRDALTGLPNRRAMDVLFERVLALHRRRRETLGVLVVDIDHFKRVNDTHGHAAGDAVLATVAGTLSSTLRNSDTVARVGGEEFLVLLPYTDAAGVVAVGEALRAAVAALEIRPVGRVTASFGGAVARAGAGTPQALQEAADGALYAAKHAGRNCVRLAETVDAPPSTMDAPPSTIDAPPSIVGEPLSL